MSPKHVHQDDYRCCLWSVERSTGNVLKGRGPRLRFHPLSRALASAPRAGAIERSPKLLGRSAISPSSRTVRWSRS